MPQAAVVVVAKFFVAVGVKGALATFAAKVFVYAATTYILNRAAKALAPKQRGVGSRTGFEVNYVDTGAPIRIAYGRVRSGGLETIPPLATGANQSMLHKVLTLTGHEIDSFNATIFDVVTVANNQISANSYNPNQTHSDSYSDGKVISGPFSGHAFIRYYRGTETVNVESTDAILFRGIGSPYFSEFLAPGISRVAVTFKFNENVYKSLPNATFVYQGKRCYDPRLDSSPGNDPTNSSYIVWTQNPALCLVDYLMDSRIGGAYESVDIDWTTVVAAANACDVLVDIPFSLTQKRYTCNGILIANEAFETNVRLLTDAMLGRVIFSNGKWRIYAGGWKTPTFSIQLSDWINGGTSTRFEQGKKKRFNKLHVWYVDKDRDWMRAQCPPQTNTAYLAADKGITIEAEVEQPLCDTRYEAHRKGRFLLRQSRNQIMIAGRLPPRFQDIALWDTGTIVDDQFGWSSKTFRAVSLDLNDDGSIDCVFAEEQSSDWDDLTAIEYNSAAFDELPEINALTPSEPTGFSISPQINGTIIFSWTRPIIYPPGTEIQVIRGTDITNAAVGTVVWRGQANPVALVMPVSRHGYWLRAVAPNSAYSAYTPSSDGIVAISRLEADQTLQNRLCGDAEFEYGEASSLWVAAVVGSSVAVPIFSTGAAGPDIGGFVWHVDLVNSTGVASAQYVASGGQYGGYMRMSANSTQRQTLLLAANPNAPRGHPFNGQPFAVEYAARVRTNSFGPIWDQQFAFGMLVEYSAPNSPSMFMATAMCEVSSSSSLRLAEWVAVKGYGVVVPPVVVTAAGTTAPLIVNSASDLYVRPFIRFLGNGGVNTPSGNFDIDYFQATARGDPNNYMMTSDVQTSVLYDFMGMIGQTLKLFISSAFPPQVTFPESSAQKWTDWRQFDLGRRFYLLKPTVTATHYTINPSSGMTLRLTGRAAVGTVTMQSTAPASAVIEKTGPTEFVVTGVGLT